MLCDIARNLEDDRLQRIKALEDDLGLTIVAFSCRCAGPGARGTAPRRDGRARVAASGEPAEPDEEQLGRIREAEESMGLALVAVRA